jgi:hypothetical protein
MRACSDRGTSRVVRGSRLTGAGDEIGSTRGFHGGCPADGMKSEADGLTGFGVAQCILVIIGATPEGQKELVGFTDGMRESSQSWRDLLLDLKRRGLTTAPQIDDRRWRARVLEGAR